MDIYYHGSKINKLNKLSKDYSSKNLPFGKGIYLTKDKSVAKAYSYPTGSIYHVKLINDLNKTINLDEPFNNQNDVIKNILKKANFNVDSNSNDTMREYLYGTNDNNIEFENKKLLHHGIWMIYGHLSYMEISGHMDKGVQYVVLNDKFIRIISEEIH